VCDTSGPPRRLTMSALIMTALERYLVDVGDGEEPKR
jgi:hypothetical protein